jgi:hypothetical protein
MCDDRIFFNKKNKKNHKQIPDLPLISLIYFIMLMHTSNPFGFQHYNLHNIHVNICSNFLELNHEEKLTKILNPSAPEQIRTVTSYIRQSLELREGDSSQS